MFCLWCLWLLQPAGKNTELPALFTTLWRGLAGANRFGNRSPACSQRPTIVPQATHPNVCSANESETRMQEKPKTCNNGHKKGREASWKLTLIRGAGVGNPHRPIAKAIDTSTARRRVF